MYYRLKGSEIFLPALKERPEDIEPLANYFANVTVKETKKPVGFSRAAMTALQTYEWPGNVRELENCAKRAVIMAEGNGLHAEDFGLEPSPVDADAFNLRRVRDQAEKDAIIRVLSRVNGNVSKAAELLGVSRPTLYDLLDKYNLRTDSAVQKVPVNE